MEEYVIKKSRIKPDALDYQRLRQYGMDYIVKLGSKLWSDYNIHDPGITTLELLCYALTDLGYRTSFDIKDILTPPGSKRPDMPRAFIPAHEILSCHPITPNDYRKWMLEYIPCIRNAWFEKYDHKVVLVPEDCFRNNLVLTQNVKDNEEVNLKGFYRMIVDMENPKTLEKHWSTFGRERNGRYTTKANYKSNIKKYCKHYIRNRFLKIRNLCEDIEDVDILDTVEIGICANIEIKSDCKHKPVIEEIGKRMNNYINPPIPFYTLAQMLEKGKPVEEIYQGYVPKLGFIDREELDRFENTKQLNVSDAINLIMGIEGVLNVRHLHFIVKDCDRDKVTITDFDSVILKDQMSYSFRFYSDDPEEPESNSLNQLVITRGLLSFEPGARIGVKSEPYRPEGVLDVELPLPSGNNRDLEQYISIQDEFPKTYKMGKEGIADSETELRKAQRLQFKAYLLFFDQLLADYLVQLNSVKDLFSWKDGNDSTYLFKNLSDKEITDFLKVFSGYKKKGKMKGYDEIIESDTVRLDRKNRFLSHLIARFNEEFVDYSILSFLNKEKGALNDFDEKELIKDKKAFLNNYVSISCDRSHAFDYTEPFFGGSGFFQRDKNVCGLEAVLYGKLGIDLQLIKKSLAPKIISKKEKIVFQDNRVGNYNDNFGLRVYEHIVMRPLPGNVDGKSFLKLTADINRPEIIKDPYSMQITIVVPGWLRISENLEFRKFIEQMIQMEVPAHIAAKVCWLNPYQMYMLETKYTKFLSALAMEPYPEKDTPIWEEWVALHTKTLKELVEVFSSLRSVYPPVQLYSNTYRTGDYSSILDYSMLGGDDHEGLWEYESTEETK